MGRRKISHVVGPFLAGLLGPLLVRCLGATWRVRLEPADLVAKSRDGKPRVWALWHGRLLVGAHTFRGAGAAVMISRHADGEVIARIVERLGFRTVRGSTTRGGATALHDAVEFLRAGGSAALTPDGPKGPREVAQAGAVYAASRSGASILPLGIGVRGAWVLGSWDRFRIPRPFTVVAVVEGEGLSPPPDIEGAALEEWRVRLEKALHDANARAEALAGQRSP